MCERIIGELVFVVRNKVWRIFYQVSKKAKEDDAKPKLEKMKKLKTKFFFIGFADSSEHDVF